MDDVYVLRQDPPEKAPGRGRRYVAALNNHRIRWTDDPALAHEATRAEAEALRRTIIREKSSAAGRLEAVPVAAELRDCHTQWTGRGDTRGHEESSGV